MYGPLVNTRKRQKILIEEKEPSGVPIGGIGAGCIEFGRDGQFRNITINNNRTADSRIPVSPGAFVATRAALKGKVSSRILQAGSELPFESGALAQFTAPDDLGWQALYPSAMYEARLDPFPIEVQWRIMATVIPYDLDASTLPLILMTVSFKNMGDLSAEVSAAINWENLCRCTRGYFPEDRGSIRPAYHEPDSHDVQPSNAIQAPTPVGLTFGVEPPYSTNAEGNYCLISKDEPNSVISYCSFNGYDPLQLGDFWSNFRDAGNLGNTISRDPKACHGAVCCSSAIEPNGGETRFIFALSWFCPRFEVNGVDLGNGYAIPFRHSLEIARRGIFHRSYFIKAIDTWHSRWLNSSLPRWYSKMLLNNNSVYSTNTLYTSSGRMAIFETPADPVTATVNRRLHTSLATLLCFPEFEKMELVQIARAYDQGNPGRICHNLGKLTVHGPNHGPNAAPVLDVNPAFILMVCRNFLMTGHRPAVESVYPRLIEAIDFMYASDTDSDGLVEHSGAGTMYLDVPVYGTCVYSSGLWIAALRAFVLLAQRLKKPQDAAKANVLFDRAATAFQRRLWSEKDGQFRLFNSAKQPLNNHASLAIACHAGQLAGQWYADFLAMGSLFPPQQIAKSLETMMGVLESQGLVRNLAMPDGSPIGNETGAGPGSSSANGWLSYNLAHYAALQIYNGNVDRGLHCIQRAYDTIHAALGRPFNQPLEWDIDNSRPAGWGQDRHIGGLAIWHTLYAIQGLLLNVPDQVLWLCPNLPKNVFFLESPIMTPLCLGTMRFKETPGTRYMQELDISFESPLSVQTFVLRVPSGIDHVEVKLQSNVGPENVTHVIGYQGTRHLLQISTRNPILVQAPISIRVTQISPPDTPNEAPQRR
jgi:uncharacterized protein (DUF608 family)